MALPRFRLTERQVLMLMMGATALAVGAAALGSSFLGSGVKKLEPDVQARIRWVRPSSNSARQLLADYFDPSLLSLPSPRGYSRAAWEHLAPPSASRYAPVIPPAFLQPTETKLASLLDQPDFTAAVLTGLERREVSNGDDLPALDPVMPATVSVVRVEGRLAARPIWKQPVMPVAPAGLAIRRTRVLLAAGNDGRVRYAVLDRSCGNAALDTEAAALAREIQFEPVAASDPLELTWGAARFSWANAAEK